MNGLRVADGKPGIAAMASTGFNLSGELPAAEELHHVPTLSAGPHKLPNGAVRVPGAFHLRLPAVNSSVLRDVGLINIQAHFVVVEVVRRTTALSLKGLIWF